MDVEKQIQIAERMFTDKSCSNEFERKLLADLTLCASIVCHPNVLYKIPPPSPRGWVVWARISGDPSDRTLRMHEFLDTPIIRQEDRPVKPSHCTACGNKAPLVLDHCHFTNQNRSWVCEQCNGKEGIGHPGPPNFQRYRKRFRYGFDLSSQGPDMSLAISVSHIIEQHFPEYGNVTSKMSTANKEGLSNIYFSAADDTAQQSDPIDFRVHLTKGEFSSVERMLKEGGIKKEYVGYGGRGWVDRRELADFIIHGRHLIAQHGIKGRSARPDGSPFQKLVSRTMHEGVMCMASALGASSSAVEELRKIALDMGVTMPQDEAAE